MEVLFGPGELTSVRVLVVEDDADSRDLLVELLEVCGLVVRAAPSAEEAFERFVEWRPDVLVSDVHLPGESGLALVRRIRARAAEEGGLTPAISISGASNASASADAGFHVHLSKPFDPLALVDVIRMFVQAGAPRSTWTLSTPNDDTVLLTFVGDVSGEDMRAATTHLAEVLERGRRSYEIAVDLRGVTGFDLSVGSIAERVMWRTREKLRSATIIGGSPLARGVARTACAILGISCTFVASWPRP